jgi:hypothetical protein
MYPVANGGCASCKLNHYCPLGQSATRTTAKACPPNTVTLKTGANSVNDCFNAPGYKYFRTSSGVRAIACGDDEYTVGLKKQLTCTKCMPGFKTDPANPPGIHTSSAVCGEWQCCALQPAYSLALMDAVCSKWLSECRCYSLPAAYCLCAHVSGSVTCATSTAASMLDDSQAHPHQCM